MFLAMMPGRYFPAELVTEVLPAKVMPSVRPRRTAAKRARSLVNIRGSSEGCRLDHPK